MKVKIKNESHSEDKFSLLSTNRNVEDRSNDALYRMDISDEKDSDPDPPFRHWLL